MRKFVAILFGLILFAVGAAAQTPPDITLEPILSTGKYPMSVFIPTQDPNDEAVFEACCDRVNVNPVISLGCEPRDGTNQVISFVVDVVKTPGDDAEVRCYTVNSEDQSDYSVNAYNLFFPLKPTTPILQ